MIALILVSFCAIIFIALMSFYLISDKSVQKGFKIILVTIDILGITCLVLVNCLFYQDQLQTAYYNGVQTKVKVKYNNTQIVKQDTIFYIE